MPTQFLLLFLALIGSLASSPQQDADATRLNPAGYRGRLQLPGQTLDLELQFAPSDAGGWRGTLDIPIQGVKGMLLEDIVVDESTLSFAASAMGAKFAFSSSAGGAWSGTLNQGGQSVAMLLTPLAPGEGVGPSRPQTPKPPFPYTVRDVRCPNGVDGIVLAGTLTLPREAGPYAALVLMTGSGPQDRDEALFGHRPFLLLADQLARAGVAVLRMDDRGIAESQGDFASATGMDFVRDACAGLDYLKTVPGIDAARLGVGGHSEGGGLAPFVARTREDVSFLVLLAGSIVPGRELMPVQLRAVLQAAGVPEQKLEEQLALQAQLLDLCIEAAPRAELRAVGEALVLAQSGVSSLEELPSGVRAQLGQAIDGLTAQFESPWMRGFLTLDAREPLSSLDIPILALNGELDLQVDAAQNLGAVEAAARKAGNDRVTTIALPGLNHLFQESSTGRIEEYPAIEETFSPDALRILVEWVKGTTTLK